MWIDWYWRWSLLDKKEISAFQPVLKRSNRRILTKFCLRCFLETPKSSHLGIIDFCFWAFLSPALIVFGKADYFVYTQISALWHLFFISFIFCEKIFYHWKYLVNKKKNLIILIKILWKLIKKLFIVLKNCAIIWKIVQLKVLMKINNFLLYIK